MTSQITIPMRARFQKFDDGTSRVVYAYGVPSECVWIVPGTWTAEHETED
jgi:hypothetical protein